MAAFNYIIQLNIAFTILLGIYHFTLRKHTDFRFNRIYLLAIALFALVVPLIKIPVIGQMELLKFPLLNADDGVNNMANEASKFDGFLIQELIAISYFSISLICLMILFVKLSRMFKQVKAMKSNASFDSDNNIFILNATIAPFTFLKWSFIPEALKHEKEASLIIAHEQSHAKDLHSIDIIIAELMTCLLFINPLHRVYKRYIADNHEYLADAVAVQHDDEAKYTDLLVKHALYPSHMSMASFFSKPTILKRINMMKTEKKNLRTKYAATFIGLLFITIMACDFQSEEEAIVIENNQNKKINGPVDVDSDQIFTVVEDQALPVDGIDEFYDFIAEELENKYPKQAQSLGIEGVVYVQFTIEKDGSLSNITAVKGIGAGCDQAAVNAVASYGKWIPGKQAGVTVRSQRVVPIRFVLN